MAIEEGKTLIFGLAAISEPDERGFRTVMATINGQMRPISVRDTSVSAAVAAAEKADTGKPGHVAAPFQGVVTSWSAEGDTVAAGDTVATIEAMKMEASITAPVAGTGRAAGPERHPGRRRRRPGARAGLTRAVVAPVVGGLDDARLRRRCSTNGPRPASVVETRWAAPRVSRR